MNKENSPTNKFDTAELGDSELDNVAGGAVPWPGTFTPQKTPTPTIKTANGDNAGSAGGTVSGSSMK
jgi:hypothetical protein